jgi:dynein heavy chain
VNALKAKLDEAEA